MTPLLAKHIENTSTSITLIWEVVLGIIDPRGVFYFVAAFLFIRYAKWVLFRGNHFLRIETATRYCIAPVQCFSP
jgi:hypothetical protein